ARSRNIRLICMVPAIVFSAAFWLLPIAVLLILTGQEGWETYFLVLTDDRYPHSMRNPLWLSVATTLRTLAPGASVGTCLARRRFWGRHALISVLTVPLAFPGVIVGFFAILIGGRQGVFASFTHDLGLGRMTFAYGVIGLFLA